jgi:hypothetical protein
MPVRLKLEDSREELMATISQRNDLGKITGARSSSSSALRQGARERAKAFARTLVLKTYGIVDKTSTAMHPTI